MKKAVALILALVLVSALAVFGRQDMNAQGGAPYKAEETAQPDGGAKAAPSQDVYILYTNDVHASITDNIGYSGIAEIKDALEKAGCRVLLVDGGDFSQGDTIATVSKGGYLVDIMNEAGYAVAAVGNHEFDYTVENLMKLREKADFPIICCNFLDADGDPVFSPYEIIPVCGINIAFVGAVSPMTISESTPSFFQNEEGEYIYDFCSGDDGRELYGTVQKYADEARENGADYVVLLSHLGVRGEGNPYKSTDVIENTRGIDAVFDAHSHTVMEKELVSNLDGTAVPLFQTGTKLEYAGLCVIRTDGSIDMQLIGDGGMSDFIEGITSQFEEEMQKVIAHTDADLTIADPDSGERIVRLAETNLGDLVADAFRLSYDADIGIVNGGAIRDSIPAGDMTNDALCKVMPFSNTMAVVEATGRQIADALELSVSCLPSEFGGFLQVSGISFTVDMSVESTVKTDSDGMFVSVEGERRVRDITVGGKALEPDRLYRVAGSSYILLESGNGYSMFDDCSVAVNDGTQDLQCAMDFITGRLKGIIGGEYSDPYGQGRISILSE